jgi:STE24 endopeptidase
MQLLVAIFIVATVAWTIASIYLSLRQSTFVQDHRDTVPGDFVTTVTRDEHRTAAEYTLAGERITRFNTLTEAALSVAWACGGINLLYGTLAATIPQSLTRGVAFLIATGIVGTIVGVPFRIYRTFRLEKRFGFNRTTPITFIADTIKRAVLALTIAVPLLYIALWIIQSATGLWWLYVWVGLVILMILAPPVYVRLIAPRFNRFEPLADTYLRNRIERLLAHSGFRSSGLFTMDASRRTTHGNAYFIGFGKSKRIVLFDTLLKRSPPEEVEAIVAHELGHFKYRHVFFALARSAVILFATLSLFGWF